ncbi:TIGR02117 family protein [Capnocytophaga sp. ARDL2]|uniref:TIGR02117 family protein n=1 Tax=Capnocytophaga sp. ARDL2 TaxID=3238809 RepID=UPI0035576CE8
MKIFLIYLLKVLLFIIGFVVLYLLAVILSPLIPVKEKQTTESKEIDVYLLTNGVHTDIVFPVKNEYKDWSASISYAHTKSQRTDFKYIAVGWGDKGFYLDTPTWADLKFSTAFNAAFGLSTSAMHCTFYSTMKEGEDCVKLSVTPSQYKAMVAFVEQKFVRTNLGAFQKIETDAVYGDNDVFYDAIGSYSFFTTCNTWANQVLKIGEQKAALWTATDKGIFRHYKN